MTNPTIQPEPNRAVRARPKYLPAGKSLADVSASIIAHEVFAERRWLFADDTLWYYHAAKPRTPRYIHDGVLFGTLDPLLVPLVRFLRGHGIDTTPSCQGHFYDVPHYREVWHKLNADGERVRGDGLVLQDAETGEAFRFRNPGYRLPWDGFFGFLQQAHRHQSVGYLGFSGLRRSEASRLARMNGPRHAEFRAWPSGYAEVVVSAPNAAAQRRAWRAVTTAVERAFGHCSVHSPRRG